MIHILHVVIKATVASAAASESQPKPLNTPRGLVLPVPRHATVSLSEFQFPLENTETTGARDYRDSVAFSPESSARPWSNSAARPDERRRGCWPRGRSGAFSLGPANGSPVLPRAEQPARVTAIMAIRIIIPRPFERYFCVHPGPRPQARDGATRGRE